MAVIYGGGGCTYIIVLCACMCVCVCVCTNASLNVNDHWLLDLAEPISSLDLGGKLDRTINRGIQNVGREHSLRSNTINPLPPS